MKKLFACLAALSVAGCDAFFAAPATSSGLDLSYSVAASSSPGLAFDKADRIHVRVSGSAGVVLDSVIVFEPAAETRVRLALESPEEPTSYTVVAELMVGSAILFTGTQAVTLSDEEQASVVMTLVPVAASVAIPVLRTLTYAGDTVTASANPMFATGDAFPATGTSWRSDDSLIAKVNATTGRIVAVSSGTTMITATAAGVSGSRAVTVAIPVVNPCVAITLQPGQTLNGEFTPQSCIVSGLPRIMFTTTLAQQQTLVFNVHAQTTPVALLIGAGLFTRPIAEGVQRSFRLTLPAGTYNNIARSFINEDGLGTFTLSLGVTSDDNNECVLQNSFSIVRGVTTQQSGTSCQDNPVNVFYDVWFQDMIAGETYTYTVTSPTPKFIEMWGGGVRLASSGTPSTTSTLTFVAPSTGQFHPNVLSADANSRGPYTLVTQ